jgi:hypothetical protein
MKSTAQAPNIFDTVPIVDVDSQNNSKTIKE